MVVASGCRSGWLCGRASGHPGTSCLFVLATPEGGKWVGGRELQGLRASRGGPGACVERKERQNPSSHTAQPPLAQTQGQAPS